MRSLAFVATIFVLTAFAARSDGIDRRVYEVRLPDEDIVVGYYEGDPFTVKLSATNPAVEGVQFYIGDGTLALQLVAHPSKGIFFQGVELLNGHVFKKGSTVKARPGYKQRSDLPPGTVYVVLPGVKFQAP